jgi:glycosyltransferase involved in cell wall biosynthesis
MNILFVSAYDAPRGQSARTYNFARELVGLGHDVTFITNGFNHFTRKEYLDSKERFRVEYIDGIRVLWLKTYPYHSNGPARFLNMLSNAWQAYFRSDLIKQPFDIVVGPSVPLFTALSGYFIAKKRKAKFVFEIRDVWPQALVDLGYLSQKSLIVRLLSMIEIFLYKKSNHIISALPFVYEHISNYGVSKNKISYIPNGVFIKPYKERNKVKESSKDIITLTYVGNFSATHGVSLILDCAARMQDEPIKFVLIGASKGYLKKFPSDNYKNVSIRPVIDKINVPMELIKSDILIASVKDTNVYQFGINSNKIYDYLAAGKPIIFSGNTPNNQIVEADAGIVIPPDDIDALHDAIMKMLEMTPAQRSELGERGRKYAEKNLDVKILSEKLIDIFESTIKGRKKC